MKSGLRVKVSLRLFTDEKCFGPGIARLLKEIDRLHSMRGAAASMEMAYSKAWRIVHDCERALGFKLLDVQIGGKRGGGARLTAEASQMLAAYEAYYENVKAYSEALLASSFAFLEEREA